MKKIIVFSAILALLSLFQGCQENDLSTDYSLSPDNSYENRFSLADFGDPVISDHLEVDWNNYNELEDENGNLLREFPAHLTIDQTLSKGEQELTQKFSVLATIGEDRVPDDFTLLKFLSYSGEDLGTVSYASKEGFSGTLYHYNLLGETIGLETYQKGRLENGVTNKGIKLPALHQLAPVFCEETLMHCGEGRYVPVAVRMFTDTYVSINGGPFNYSYSTFQGTRTEWTWVPSNGGNRGTGGNGGDYHRHTPASHTPSNVPKYNHKDEIIWDVKAILEELAPETPITDLNEFLKCYDTSKSAVVTIYADQPVNNSSVPIIIENKKPNPGHAFISISQGGKTSTFGFYPSAEGIKSAIPGHSIIGNNGGDSYDISISKAVSGNVLSKVLDKAKNYPKVYDLNIYNCTNFARDLGNLSGMNIPSAWGMYPGTIPGGQNPGKLGQVIRNMNVDLDSK